MRVGVFTALLAQLSLDDVLKKLKTLHIATVELGTGNYPGELSDFKHKLSPEEGLTSAAGFLNGIVMRQQIAAPWWV